MSVDLLRKRLISSGLLAEEDLRTLLNELPAAKRPADAAGLAKLLIRTRKLTEYQAKQLMRGETKSLVFGNYVVFDKIGEGGMGVVLKARHQRMDRIVAVKVLPEKALKSADAVDRFYREVKAVARLSHPNVVAAFDADEHDGMHYFVMEYVEGQDLAHVGHQRGPLPVAEAVGYIAQAARGLEYAHAQGVVHRDIKPGNLLLDASGTVKILDMGLARFDLGEDESAPLTRSGQVMGTGSYMAPEQAEDTHRADHRADIYSLGCSLYRLLTNKAMYSGDTLVQVLLAHRDQPIPSIRGERPDVSEELDRVYEKMVAKRPGDRYQSMGEAASALESCLETVPVGAGGVDTAPLQTEPKSDSHLKTFLNQFSPGRETIQQQVDMETGEAPQPVAAAFRKSQPWWIYTAISAGAVLVIVLGIAFLRPKHVEQNAPARGQNESVAKEAPGPDLLQQQPERVAAEMTATEEPDEPTAAAPESAEEPSTDEVLAETRPESEMQPEEFAEPEPAPTPAVPQPPKVDPAEIGRRELLEKQRALEATYTTAMKSVEEKATAWDFAAAWQAAEALSFEEPELAARLESRRDEIRRMELLKRRIITKVGQTNPPLKKSDLRIRGIGGTITDAGPAGLTTKTIKNEVERLTWNNLGNQAACKLMELVVEPTNGNDCIAAGLLAFTSGDRAASERFFDQAKATGADTSAHLNAMVAAAFAQANDLLSQEEFEKAASLLENLETKYADLPWLAANRDAFAAASAIAQRGVREAEAEALYAKAIALREADSLFDLREVVVRLKSNYADCIAVSDATRKPQFAELVAAIADVGQKLTVRLDGKGDHTSIQAAIDAAGANSLIEIQDAGPYREQIVLKNEGVTLRGQDGLYPIVASPDLIPEDGTLIDLVGNSTAIERLVLLYTNPRGGDPTCVHPVGDNLRLNALFLYAPAGNGLANYYGEHFSENSRSIVRNSLVIAGTSTLGLDYQDCLLLGEVGLRAGTEVHSCTVLSRAGLNAPTYVYDSIVQDLNLANGRSHLSRCNIFDGDLPEGSQECFQAKPGFRDPANLDYRLRPGSPCIGRASDGGDIGVRYTPELMELCRIALELRAKGVIRF